MRHVDIDILNSPSFPVPQHALSQPASPHSPACLTHSLPAPAYFAHMPASACTSLRSKALPACKSVQGPRTCLSACPPHTPACLPDYPQGRPLATPACSPLLLVARLLLVAPTYPFACSPHLPAAHFPALATPVYPTAPVAKPHALRTCLPLATPAPSTCLPLATFSCLPACHTCLPPASLKTTRKAATTAIKTCWCQVSKYWLQASTSLDASPLKLKTKLSHSLDFYHHIASLDHPSRAFWDNVDTEEINNASEECIRLDQECFPRVETHSAPTSSELWHEKLVKLAKAVTCISPGSVVLHEPLGGSLDLGAGRADR
ncbi:hypothetical protein GGX14DRAFT_559142 [Mycena pura]|uniref:Uncharacterized protein n=1 Tax=Mycena pura TaxID=153505 RepID=A0AAD6VSZ9_9AGAR|nr:hypothetical protein GGX14DRAFT_559142 [Mycena pura]